MRTLPLRRMQAIGLLVLFAVFSLTPIVAAVDNSHEIIILHTNDLHGQLVPYLFDDEMRGGLARLAGVVQTFRDRYPNQVLWLDAGDTWHGSNLATFSRGESVVDILNLAGLDAQVLGNHDFNYGINDIYERVAEANFIVLADNVMITDRGEALLPATARFKINGLSIGIIGLISPDTPTLTHPSNVEGLEFHDPVTIARKLTSQLTVDTDLIIAVTHLGLTYDRILAEAVPEIDVIVSGHSHTLLLEPEVVAGTPIVQANDWGKYLGVLHIAVGNEGIVAHDGYLIPITDDLPEDTAIAAAIAQWEVHLDARLAAIVGETQVDLDGDNVRTQETNLGNLVADIVRDHAQADIALVNSGGIRRSINAGPIPLATVFEVSPFDNTVIGIEITGEQLLAALENSVLYYPERSGRFLQVSGLSYTFDPSAPPGERVVEVYIHPNETNPNGEALQLNQVYRAAVIDFMALGGDDYAMFIDAPVFFGSTTEGGTYLRDLLVEFIEQASPIAPETMGRIQLKETEVSGF